MFKKSIFKFGLFFWIIGSAVPVKVKAQVVSQIQIDSIKNILAQDISDTLRVKQLIKLYSLSRGANPMQAKESIKEAFTISKDKNYKRGIMLSHFLLGSHHSAYELDYKAAFTHYQMALVLSQKLNYEL